MSELSPELQQLVQAGKVAVQPSDADRARVYRSLELRLGLADGAMGVTGASVGDERARGISLKVASLVSAGVMLVVGGGAFLHSTFRQVERPPVVPTVMTVVRPLSEAKATPAPVQPGSEVVAPPQVASEVNEAPTKPASPRASSRPHDSLSEEVAIMTRAEKELHAGRAASALSLLSEHERRYKNGLLAEERTAARIQALCALGRVSEANALLGRLSPKSLHGEPARQACGAAKQAPTTK
ncbi:MAG: hypothetical protein QM784_28265 [Polyangiaceae bacterium]